LGLYLIQTADSNAVLVVYNSCMDSLFEIRRAVYPDDYPAMVEVWNSCSDWQTKAETVALEDRIRDSQLHLARFVAVWLEGNQKKIVGVLELGHNSHSHEAGKYFVGIDVHSDFRQRGIARECVVVAQNHLETLGDVHKVQTMFDSDQAGALHLMSNLGFVQVWERVESRLMPRDVDLGAYTALDSSLQTAGIEIRSLAEFDLESVLPTLYALDSELLADVPFGQPSTITPFEPWRSEFLENDENDPKLIWLAIKDGQWIGFTSLIHQAGFFMIGMTGVKREYRGLGIAKRLKLEGVRHALPTGLEIRTFNDHSNTAMMNMNQQMGFVRFRSRLRFEKIIEVLE
jgi:mycothiol synthase